MTKEEMRLLEARERRVHWRRWGPYLSERQWGTVREDYSEQQIAWDYFPHDHAHSRAYRWGEDGLLGISDNHQRLCFAVALWNERDPILKERLFGLTNTEGNHGEDVKEHYYYLDGTPTHSYMKALYCYPQAAFPYHRLVEENRRRSALDPEFELADTGIFNEQRYFEVVFEYAKAAAEDILIRITAVNRGPEQAPLHLLPTLWFRNTWIWTAAEPRPRLRAAGGGSGRESITAEHPALGMLHLSWEGRPQLLFTENETNTERLFTVQNPNPYRKDSFHRFVVEGDGQAVNPAMEGTKAALHYQGDVAAGAARILKLRLSQTPSPPEFWETVFEEVLSARRSEADEFYQRVAAPGLSQEARNIQRQAFAGLLWNKQFYHYVVQEWLDGDSAMPPPPASRKQGRNKNWAFLYNDDILSMPDKWEYPWFAAWDLAFHCLPLAMIDPDFAKRQLVLLTREWFMHPNGQLPAYEWAFDDVNPPVHAWSAWRVYKIEQKMYGRSDVLFLERVFQKLLLNFTWWVNRKDADGKNIFQGGFLGLDNIGVFDRSRPLPMGGSMEQSDATSWMACYCLNLLAVSIELAKFNPSYEDIAGKFFEHFLYIAYAMNHLGREDESLWDEGEGFFFDHLHLPDGNRMPLKVFSMVGLIPLFAIETLEIEDLFKLPDLARRLNWFMENRPQLSRNVTCNGAGGACERRILSIVTPDQLRRVLARMLSEDEFLSPYGIRSLSRYHREHPYVLTVNGVEHRVEYEPAESTSGFFGGNSNWRGPVWVPVNYLMIEALQKFHHYLGDDFRVECPTGSGRLMNLWQVSMEIARRVLSLYLTDPACRKSHHEGTGEPRTSGLEPAPPLFYEYFHGDNGAGLGASHQTGWTGLVSKLLQQVAEYCGPDLSP